MAARLDPVPATHVLLIFDQLRLADTKLFQLLAEQTRAGIQVKSGGRSLDHIFEAACRSPEVLHILQPMPRSAGSTRKHPPFLLRPLPDSGFERPGPYKHKGWQERRNRKGNRSSPQICFGYGLKTCREAVSRGRCKHGLHPALDCPI